MEDELILVKPSIEYEEQAINFINEVELVDTDEKIRYAGFSELQKYKDNYIEWLKKLELYKKEETLPEGKVIADTFFTVKKSDNKLVGIINIRHELNDSLYNYGGHIGYSILPSERRRGYAYKQLLLGLEYYRSIGVRRVMISCLDYNIGSAKTIEKAGGVYENTVKGEKCGQEVYYKRYWVSLKKR
ncbi:MAG: GNAT family N-acetyltransferase [Clostridia bacterium]|nr:GNAT family N-acetyltransferase [Clostridia bacterium]